MTNQRQFQNLIAKIQKSKTTSGLDLSTEEDLSIAIMNLISLEEHFYFTAEKTAKPDYLDLLAQVREIRKNLLARMIDSHEGETWCISKHLLATTMRLIEVGTKLYQDGDKKKAQETFDYGYKLWNLFWGLRLKLIDTKDIKQTAAEDKPWSLQDIVTKMVDCCKE